MLEGDKAYKNEMAGCGGLGGPRATVVGTEKTAGLILLAWCGVTALNEVVNGLLSTQILCQRDKEYN